MLQEFLDRLLELQRPETVEVHGRVYSTLGLNPVGQPMAEPVGVGTLTGLVDLYRSDLDNVRQQEVAIHVLSHECVRLIELGVNTWAKRRVYVSACHEGGKNFSFGQWLSPEQFIIGLQSMFYPTEDQKELQELLSVCSTISAETLSISEDDGVTQKATVGRSVAFKENKKIKPIVSLQPYRTFSDIEQPSSNFLFRLHQSHDGKSVQCMLTEADGGVWKQVAMQSIKDWFERQGLNVPIIA